MKIEMQPREALLALVGTRLPAEPKNLASDDLCAVYVEHFRRGPDGRWNVLRDAYWTIDPMEPAR